MHNLDKSIEFPAVSILILNWNGAADTLECLDSLKKIDYPSYEIIVVDNSSSGDDVNIIKSKCNDSVTVIKNDQNLGFAEGNNVGIRYILANRESKYIFLLNNDTTVKVDFLSQLVKVAEADSSIGMVGPEIHLYDRPEKIHSRGGVINLYTGWHFVGGSFHRPPYNDDSKFILNYYSGAAVMIRTEVIKKVGAFDPDYFYYTEDVDLGYRIFRAGYKIVCARKSIIYHKEGRSVGGNIRNPKTAYFETRNALLFVRKHGRWCHLMVFVPVLLLKMVYDLLKFFPDEKKVLGSRLRGLWWHVTNRRNNL